MDTSLINTILLLGIVAMIGFVLWFVRNSATTTYDNICKHGIDVTLPEGSLINKNYPVIGTLKIPTSDTVVKVNVKCD